MSPGPGDDLSPFRPIVIRVTFRASRRLMAFAAAFNPRKQNVGRNSAGQCPPVAFGADELLVGVVIEGRMTKPSRGNLRRRDHGRRRGGREAQRVTLLTGFLPHPGAHRRPARDKARDHGWSIVWRRFADTWNHHWMAAGAVLLVIDGQHLAMLARMAIGAGKMNGAARTPEIVGRVDLVVETDAAGVAACQSGKLGMFLREAGDLHL